MKLVPLSAVRPSTYNPRTADPARLDLIELSLRKLGFLLPIYADQGGEVLSGHQRHLVAERMGAQRIPVEFTRAMALAERKAINIAFNRGTNDLRSSDTPEALTAALRGLDLDGLAAAIPDKAIDDPAFFPCLNARPRDVATLVRANKGRWIPYAANLARSLAHRGIAMPVVVGPGDHVVNGIGRVELAAKRRQAKIDVVELSAAEAALAEALLNLLSMDFDLHTRYADLLRYNSFRRAIGARNALGRTFVFGLIGSKSAVNFDIRKPADQARWVAHYGRTVLDFGAGHLTETALLRAAGVDCVPFEPFRLGAGDEIDKAASVATTRAFLERVARGVSFDSIFLATVLNSVPFKADREHIIAILSALCGPTTRVYAAATTTNTVQSRAMRGGDYVNVRSATQIRFPLAYEPNVSVGDISDRPKVQKYHTPREWYDLWKRWFTHVGISRGAANVECTCFGARPVEQQQLRAALAFEFDLPYPDGSRMGLVDEAVGAFVRRGVLRA